MSSDDSPMLAQWSAFLQALSRALRRSSIHVSAAVWPSHRHLSPQGTVSPVCVAQFMAQHSSANSVSESGFLVSSDGQSKGYGFASFELADALSAAVSDLPICS